MTDNARTETLVTQSAVTQSAPAERAPGVRPQHASALNRVIGTETEYGIIDPHHPDADPRVMSSQLVTAYLHAEREESGTSQAASSQPVAWDYSDESPLVDARGWSLEREAADASQLTDVEPARINDSLVMNLVATNGARFYVDHAHPEYSAPESADPRTAVLYDAAGDVLARKAMAALEAREPELALILYRNNTDGQVSYGAHENYLVPRQLPFKNLVRSLTPFFVSRQIFAGAGRVGLGQSSAEPGFQISQRADFFEEEVGLETTIRRPIINTRDEPHALATKFRRLHVIVGDTNQAQYASWLKLATTSLVLSLIEAGAAPEIELEDPVGAMHAISHDLSFANRYRLRGGSRVSAIDIQRMYVAAAQRWVDSTDSAAHELIHSWSQVLDQLESDPLSLRNLLDWPAKLALMEEYRDRRNLEWTSPVIRLIDLQYADIREHKSIYSKLVATGKMRTLFSEQEIFRAASEPPAQTRAYLRGRMIKKFGSQLYGANWDSLLLRNPDSGKLQRIEMKNPYDFTEAQVGHLLDASDELGEFLAQLLS